MKLIPLREFPTAKTIDIIKDVVQRPSSANGFSLPEFRAHVRVLRALDKNITPAGLMLEDGDHETLTKAFQSSRYVMASIEADQIVTDILDAKEPPAASKLPDEPAETAAA